MQVAFLVTEGAFDSGLATVCDVFGAANMLRDRVGNAVAPWNVTLIGTRSQVRTAGGHLVDVTTATRLAQHADILIVPALGLRDPAGLVEVLADSRFAAELDVIRSFDAEEAALAGACTGTLFLAEAGILDGEKATTSWWLWRLFRERYPRVRLDTTGTLVSSGRVRTAGAAFAHIELALSLVGEVSPDLADLVARYLMIGKRAGQAECAIPPSQSVRHPEMARFEAWVLRHIGEAIRIGDAAAAVGVSERTLQRITASAAGVSPLGFVNDVRLQEALFLLESTTLPVEAVARRVGFRNSSTLRLLIRRKTGSTVSAIRHSGRRR